MLTPETVINHFFPKKRSKLLKVVEQAYAQKHRYWHNIQHIEKLLAQTDNEELGLIILFHDIVYNPRKINNEAASAEMFERLCPDLKGKNKIAQVIIESSWKNKPVSKLGKKLFELDCQILIDKASIKLRLAYELAIFKEFQYLGLKVFKQQRKLFLEKWIKNISPVAAEQVEILEAFEPTRAIYPGSFNPLHLGHLSTLREEIFDQVIFAVGNNKDKNQTHSETRAGKLSEIMEFHQIFPFEGLLADALKAYPACSVLRSIRNGTDLDIELHWRRFMQELAPEHAVVWVGCEPESQHISSSAIRQLEACKTGSGEKYKTSKEIAYGSNDGS